MLEEWNARAQKSNWGVVPRAQEPLINTNKIRRLEEEFIPESLQRDCEKTFGPKKHCVDPRDESQTAGLTPARLVRSAYVC